MAKSLTRLIFNKGGFGTHLTRADTVERLNPLIRQHMELNHWYNDVIRRHPDPGLASQLAASQKIARVDVGKLMETVFSAGGTAYNGVDLEPERFYFNGEDPDEALRHLQDLETSFYDALKDELKLKHQLRTEATLNILYTNSQRRLNLLKEHVSPRRRPERSS